MATKKPKKLEVLKTETQQLAVKLTDDEKREFGWKLAQLHAELDAQLARAKDVKAQLKADEERLTSQIAQVALVVRQGAEVRPVRVDHHANPKKGVVREIRLDTGECVRERELLDHERQRAFPAVAAAEQKAAAEAQERAEESK